MGQHMPFQHSILASVVSKSERKPKEPDEQISVAHEVAMVKEQIGRASCRERV